MKTQAQLEKYAQEVRYTRFSPYHKRVDNIHDAILKMDRFTEDMLEMEDEIFDAIEAAERAFEVFKAARRKALNICYETQKNDHQDGSQMAERICELIALEKECFDPEDIDSDLLELARQRRNEYFASTRKMMTAVNDFIQEKNTKIIMI